MTRVNHGIVRGGTVAAVVIGLLVSLLALALPSTAYAVTSSTMSVRSTTVSADLVPTISPYPCKQGLQIDKILKPKLDRYQLIIRAHSCRKGVRMAFLSLRRGGSWYREDHTVWLRSGSHFSLFSNTFACGSRLKFEMTSEPRGGFFEALAYSAVVTRHC